MSPEQRAADRKPRVLHVLASLTLGGIETWLVHMLRHRDQFSVSHETLLTKPEPGAYEDEVRRMGVPIHRLLMGSSRRAWLKRFRGFLEDKGPFDAVHSHVYLFSAPVLSAAKAAGVPVRIAHCHTARSQGRDHRSLRHRLRRAVAIAWLKRSATRRIGISDAATEEIAGSDWRSDPSASVLIYGFDFSRYAGASERGREFRRNLGLDEQAPVIGHVGRFEPVKNHAFLLKAFAALLDHKPDARLVLVGDGPIHEAIKARSDALGLAGKVLFAGATDDVPAYMTMFDLFALPSFSEGLGIVCVEAQAAGTLAVVSDAVPPEVSVIPGAIEYLSLDAGAKAWGEAFDRRLGEPSLDPAQSLAELEQSRFGIKRCIEELDAIYRTEMARAKS